MTAGPQRLWSRWRPVVEVGDPYLTSVFWGILAIFVGALCLSPVLPFGDYNYHLALGGILRRMLSPDSPEAHLYRSNLFSYNAGFQVTVAALSLVMPTPYAGLVVFAGSWIGFALVAIALARALGAPTERAFAIFPLLVAMPFGWGFINYCMGLVLQLYALVRVMQRSRKDAPLAYDALTALLVVLGLWSHLFSTAIGFMLSFVVLVVRTYDDRAPTLTSYLRTVREGLVFVPAIAIGVAMHLHHRQYASRYVDRYNDFYAAVKADQFIQLATNFFADNSDRKRLKYALCVLFAVAIFRARPGRKAAPYPALKAWLLISLVVLYLLMPEYWIQIAVLCQRIPMVLVLVLAVALPRAHRWAEKAGAAALAVIGLQCALAFLHLRREELPDLRDFKAVIDEAPRGRRLAIHVPHAQLAGQTWAWAGHLAPYYVAARRGIESSVSYAGIPSNPVHYRGAVPVLAPDGVAQGTQAYSPSAPYAKRFDLVLVRTLEADPAPKLWPARPGAVDVVAHHGHWWMFDARRYYE